MQLCWRVPLYCSLTKIPSPSHNTLKPAYILGFTENIAPLYLEPPTCRPTNAKGILMLPGYRYAPYFLESIINYNWDNACFTLNTTIPIDTCETFFTYKEWDEQIESGRVFPATDPADLEAAFKMIGITRSGCTPGEWTGIPIPQGVTLKQIIQMANVFIHNTNAKDGEVHPCTVYDNLDIWKRQQETKNPFYDVYKHAALGLKTNFTLDELLHT